MKVSFYYSCQKKDQIKYTILLSIFCGQEHSSRRRQEERKRVQLVHMADSHMTCKQCGLALRRRKNNMTFLAHKLVVHCLSKRKLIIVNTIHYKPWKIQGVEWQHRRNQLLGRFGSAFNWNEKQSKKLVQPCHFHCFL